MRLTSHRRARRSSSPRRIRCRRGGQKSQPDGDRGASGRAQKSIPLSEIGAKASADYKGDAIGIKRTVEGAALYTKFQKLAGVVTREGLMLESTAEKGGRFSLVADAIGRTNGERKELARHGSVMAGANSVIFSRPGLVEEYSVSVDGVRQDFVIPGRPGGEGDVATVELEVTGARVEAAAFGAKLVLSATSRELAYSRLHVTDAKGRVLTARMEVHDSRRLAICVEDEGAEYPVRVDPVFGSLDWVALNTEIPGANGTVSAIAIDGGGNLYVGGSFTAIGTVSADHAAKWNGTTWSPLGLGLPGTPNALVVDASGNLYAGGVFSNFVVKWDGNGWAAVGGGVAGGNPTTVYAMAVDGAGNLYVGGDFTAAGGVAATRIARWDGSVWSPLGSGLGGTVYALVADGGDIYAGGSFSTAGGVAANNVAKWNGGVWTALGSGTSSRVRALAVSGSHLYAGGTFSTAGGVTVQRIAKWNGSQWSALSSGMSGGTSTTVYSLAVDVLGDLYAGGDFATAGGVTANNFAKWNGSEWSALGTGLNGIVNALAVEGTVAYAGGAFTMAGAATASSIAKWNGTEWLAFGSGMNNSANALVVSGSDLYAGGTFTTAPGGVAANHVAKWNGSTWSALGSGIDGTVSTLAMSGGDLYAGGTFTTAGGVAASNIAKWNGTSWSALGSGVNGPVLALATRGNDLYAGGLFTSAGAVQARRIAKWDGSVWSALSSGVGPTGAVNALAFDAGGNLYAGGTFTSPANRIAKWDGSAWSSIGSGLTWSVYALAVNGNDIYAGGDSGSLARWKDSTWSRWSASDDVYSLAINAAGQVFVGGKFVTAGSTYSPFVARAHPIDGAIISVEKYPSYLPVAEGESVDFGPLVPGYSLSKTFRIQNTGSINLTSLAITIDGADAAEFTVTTQPTSPVPPFGVGTGFVVQFAPTATGTRNAALHIASNVTGSANPYDIMLTGYGRTFTANWLLTYFGTMSATGNAADDFDFDGDGLVNLVERAFGLDPTQGSSAQLPQGQMNGGNFTVSFNEPAGMTGITYGAEWSATMQPLDWHTIPDTGTPPQHVFSVPATGQIFVRLKVTGQ